MKLLDNRAAVGVSCTLLFIVYMYSILYSNVVYYGITYGSSLHLPCDPYAQFVHDLFVCIFDRDVFGWDTTGQILDYVCCCH